MPACSRAARREAGEELGVERRGKPSISHVDEQRHQGQDATPIIMASSPSTPKIRSQRLCARMMRAQFFVRRHGHGSHQ
jgi:hypothetical protein